MKALVGEGFATKSNKEKNNSGHAAVAVTNLDEMFFVI